MKFLKGALAMAGLIAYSSMSAHADTTYDWTFSAPGISGAGTVTLGAVGGADFGPGGYVATSATGTLDLDINGTYSNGVTVTGLWAPAAASSSQSITLDNIVYPSGGVPANFYGFVDSDGLGVTLSNGDDLDIVLTNNQLDEYTARVYDPSQFGVLQPFGPVSVALTPAPVPLPPSGILIIPGLLGLGLFARRTARQGLASLPMAA